MACPLLTQSPCHSSWGHPRSSNPQTLSQERTSWASKAAADNMATLGLGAEFAESCSFPVATSLCVYSFCPGLPWGRCTSGRRGCGSAAPKASSFWPHTRPQSAWGSRPVPFSPQGPCLSSHTEASTGAGGGHGQCNLLLLNVDSVSRFTNTHWLPVDGDSSLPTPLPRSPAPSLPLSLRVPFFYP